MANYSGIILIDRTQPLWRIDVMGDRFYEAQRRKRRPPMANEKKVPRKLKSDWIKDIHMALGVDVPGLDKCTIDTLIQLLKAIEECNNGT